MTDQRSSKTKIKDDAKGAMAPSQGDSRNDGAHNANPAGDRDSARTPDGHSAPSTPGGGVTPIWRRGRT